MSDKRPICPKCLGRGGWETGPHSEECRPCNGTGFIGTPSPTPPGSPAAGTDDAAAIPAPTGQDRRLHLPEEYDIAKLVRDDVVREPWMGVIRRCHAAETALTAAEGREAELREALTDLINSHECYAYTSPTNAKQEAEYDEYDSWMAPKWKRAALLARPGDGSPEGRTE